MNKEIPKRLSSLWRILDKQKNFWAGTLIMELFNNSVRPEGIVKEVIKTPT
jgi:hypothetical protein